MPGEAGAGRPRPPCRAVVRRRDGGRHRRGSRSARSSATLPTTGRCRSAAPARWRVCSRRRSPARRVFRVAAGIRPAAAGDHRREPRAARAATDRTGRPCLGARRGVAPAPRRRARGDARTRGRGRRVQGGVRTPGRRGEPHRSAAVACAAGRDARRGRALSRLTGTADPRPCCLQPGRQRSARGCGPEIAALPEVVEAARPRRTPTHEPPGPAARCRAVRGQEGREECAVGRSVPGGDGGGRDVQVPADHLRDGADRHALVGDGVEPRDLQRQPEEVRGVQTVDGGSAARPVAQPARYALGPGDADEACQEATVTFAVASRGQPAPPRTARRARWWPPRWRGEFGGPGPRAEAGGPRPCPSVALATRPGGRPSVPKAMTRGRPVPGPTWPNAPTARR